MSSKRKHVNFNLRMAVWEVALFPCEIATTLVTFSPPIRAGGCSEEKRRGWRTCRTGQRVVDYNRGCRAVNVILSIRTRVADRDDIGDCGVAVACEALYRVSTPTSNHHSVPTLPIPPRHYSRRPATSHAGVTGGKRGRRRSPTRQSLCRQS